MITSWFAQLDRAKSIPEVISVIRDFLATWTPTELALLPEACRPSRVRDEEDLESLHSSLVEAYRTTRASGNALEALQRLTSFVVRASIRVAEISPASSRERGEDPDDPDQSLAPRGG
jgi:hypothetical protein